MDCQTIIAGRIQNGINHRVTSFGDVCRPFFNNCRVDVDDVDAIGCRVETGLITVLRRSVMFAGRSCNGGNVGRMYGVYGDGVLGSFGASNAGGGTGVRFGASNTGGVVSVVRIGLNTNPPNECGRGCVKSTIDHAAEDNRERNQTLNIISHWLFCRTNTKSDELKNKFVDINNKIV